MVTRFGTLSLRRQVLSQKQGSHLIPANAVLPDHEGMIITRGLQEWVCLLPQQLSFASTVRLLGWQVAEEGLLSDTTVRHLVGAHGQIIRQAELAEARALQERPDLQNLSALLVLAPPSRPRFGWKPQMNAAITAALEQGSTRPPTGVTAADWERVITARKQETTLSLDVLRQLGPRVRDGETLAFVDEVLTRTPEHRKFWQLRTAEVVTSEGIRYFSGNADTFLLVLTMFLRLCAVSHPSLRVLSDGARWIRFWFVGLLAFLPNAQLRLDWYHLCKKCRELACMFCHGRASKKDLLKPLFVHLWNGDVCAAVGLLEAYRATARNMDALDELIRTLQEREAFIPNYRANRRECHYIGSGLVEKANDLLVSQRQKGQGMHWSLQTSDALAALQTLLLNGGWDRYRQDREVLPLVAN